MNSLDLFSCVGNHALGFERAGIETVMFCESNAWRRQRLMALYPETPIHEDIKNFNADNCWADVCVGGPPCQKTSVSAAIHGYRSGESLWPYQFHVGLNALCEWFVVEQPPGNAAWEAQVCRDLSRAGYHTARLEFGACDIGAPYIRRRVFLVACASLPRLEVAWSSVPSQIESVKRAAVARGDWDPNTIPSFGVDTWRSEGVDERFERIEALGDSNPPHMAEVIGRAIKHAQAA